MILSVLLAMVGASGSFAEQQDSLEGKIKSQKRELQDIQKQIDRHRAKSVELLKKEKSLLNRVTALEKEAALSTKLLALARNQETLLEQKIDSLRVRIGIEGEKLSYQRDKLAVRVKQLYMQEPNFKWAILMGSESLQEMFRRQKFLMLVAERDAALFKTVKEHKLSLEHEQAELTEALVDVAALRKTREKETNNLKASRASRVAMLKSIKNEKSKHEQAIHELEQAQQKVKDLLEAMEKTRLEQEKKLGIAGAVDFAGLKGKLIRPVKGKIVKAFGKTRHPKFGTVTINSGIDIKAASGSPIRAVAGGVIEFVDWITGYGRCIIINHGRGYYTLYAHVSKVFVQPQQTVSQGEVIAEVGDTGSMEGYVCHFEIRKSKKALNPMEWFGR